MQIIIPMTGQGARFQAAGYERLKPFIKIHGKPMIGWVVKMFPGDEKNITFICRREHLESLEYMERELKQVAPDAKIIALEEWRKQGPVADIMRIKDTIDDAEPVLVSYCDYYMRWDYKTFKDAIKNRNCDGAVPCYSGFHPNLIPQKNLYASCKVSDKENLVEIREKFSWEKDKTKARHSPGVYYFSSGRVLKKYCQQMIDADDSINGEYYASLPFNYMVRDSLDVWCPVNVEYFCQWGTPEDLEDYLFWMKSIQSVRNKK